ncbi:MAG TPA: hypothetical protein VM073_10295 [Usitatibacter sp.]|nr:hypothetical protein [Usitatibacter sp.]
MERTRIGLLLDGYTVPRWVHRLVEIVAAENDVVVAVVNAAPPPPRLPFLKKLVARRDYLLYGVWRRIDDRLFATPDDAFEPADLSSLLSQVPRIDVVPEQTKFSDRLNEPDLERIRSYKPDILIRLGFRILRGDVLRLAPHGVWSLHHGDNFVNRGGPPGVWEVLNNDLTTGSILQVLTEDMDGGVVLARTWSGTDHISVNRSLQPMYWKTLHLIPRALRRLREVGPEEFMRQARERQEPYLYTHPLIKTPTTFELLPRLLSLGWRNARRWIKKTLKYEQWMMFRGNTAVYRFERLVAPSHRTWWADPCVVEHEGKTVVFFEELPYGKRGHISVMDEAGVRRVLERPYHLSYPFVFPYAGHLYMIPESKENRTIELYRCESFPDKWQFVMNLMENVDAVDTTVWIRDSKVWLFAGMAPEPAVSACEELFLFHADTLLTRDWKPHPLNPVVSDIRRARPAGRIFEHNGKWYRPSQDCSGSYGRGLNINRIDALSESDYAETRVAALEARWDKGLTGVHTLSSAGGITYVDGFAERWKWQ